MENDINLLELLKPFAEKDLEWRPQLIMPNKKGDMMALVLCYVTARAVMTRLDNVVGQSNWKDEYQHLATGVMCGISISTEAGEWVTKWDGAEETQIEAFKGGISSAFKRTAVKWGVGRYLYELEDTWVNLTTERPLVNEKWRMNRTKHQGNTYYFVAPEMPSKFKIK